MWPLALAVVHVLCLYFLASLKDPRLSCVKFIPLYYYYYFFFFYYYCNRQRGIRRQHSNERPLRNSDRRAVPVTEMFDSKSKTFSYSLVIMTMLVRDHALRIPINRQESWSIERREL